MSKINVLGFDVANLIAAGEVVDRPASVVKELLENALDAGGTKIKVEISRGGVSLIRVEDNGCGIDGDDLPLSLLRHATSKIKTAADLDVIGTLGFRGEALAAISSVSKIKMYTRCAEDTLGHMLEAEGGEITMLAETACIPGTIVVVEDLFYNVPARRKFLKKDSTEAAAVSAVVEKIALSRPDVSIKYVSDGEIKFMTSGKGELSETIWALFGKETAKRSLKVEREEDGIKVSGYVSEPDIHKPNRNMENFFINGRYVKTRTASAALEQAYTSKIPSDRFPFAVLNIELNPAAVDVNVHPAKLEVKFANEKLIFDAVYYAVLSALEADVKRPELQLGSPDRVGGMKTDGGFSGASLKNAFVPLDKREKKAEQIVLGGGQEEAAYTKPEKDPRTADAWHNTPSATGDGKKERRHTGSKSEGTVQRGRLGIEDDGMSYLDVIRMHREAIEAANLSENVGGQRGDTAEGSAGTPAEQLKTAAEMSVSEKSGEMPAPEKTVEIHEEEKGEISRSDIPDYIILGEAYNCYVIVQLSDRLLMIDKHAAHERIIFDELVRKMRKLKRGGQLLLAPCEMTVSGAEAEALSEYEDKIKALGFGFEVTQESAAAYKVSISEIPESLDNREAVTLFEDLATRLSDVTASVESASAEFFEAKLWQASCKAAMKGGRIYDMAHIKWICDRLLVHPSENGSVIRTCPHGRPVAFEIKKSSIERQFARIE